MREKQLHTYEQSGASYLAKQKGVYLSAMTIDKGRLENSQRRRMHNAAPVRILQPVPFPSQKQLESPAIAMPIPPACPCLSVPGTLPGIDAVREMAKRQMYRPEGPSEGVESPPLNWM